MDVHRIEGDAALDGAVDEGIPILEHVGRTGKSGA